MTTILHQSQPRPHPRALPVVLLAPLLAFLSAPILTPAPALAQCVEAWQPGPHGAGIFGDVLSMTMWDPDGPGPSQDLLVLAGSITQAAGLAISRVATFNPSTGTWQALGAPGGNVVDVGVLADGTLVAAGNFAGGVKRWTGSTWQTLTTGSGPTFSGGQGVVTAMTVRNNQVCAVGLFNAWDGTPCNGMARWIGTSWTCFGNATSTVSDIAIDAQGRELTAESGMLRRWGSAPFTAMVTGLNQQVQRVWSMGDLGAGDRFVITGSFTSVAGIPATARAYYNGSSWQAMPYAANGYTMYGPVASRQGTPITGAVGNALNGDGLLRWNGSAWAPLATGLNGAVTTLAVRNDGAIYVAGTFTNAGGVATPRLALWALPPGCACDSIDFNQDGASFDPTDIDAFLSVYSEGPCIPATASCNDIDFNNDGASFDPCDIDAFLLLYSEGPCTPCGQ